MLGVKIICFKGEGIELKKCNVEGCEDKHEAKGFCKRHYRRFIKYGDPLKGINKQHRKSSEPYNSNHKYIDNTLYKKCNNCNQWSPMDVEYFYKNPSSKDEFNPECKVCTKRRVKERRKNPINYEKHVEQQRERNLLLKVKKQKKKWRDSEKGKQNRDEWTSNNKEKLKQYNLYHNLHKTHEITKEEWEICKEYFDNCCSYCGITEEESIDLYGQHFHKEHAVNEGSNDITNCVPACKGCNTSKWKNDYETWYWEGNPKFSQQRLHKIIKWLEEDSLKLLNQATK